jgi:hypothetical protein
MNYPIKYDYEIKRIDSALATIKELKGRMKLRDDRQAEYHLLTVTKRLEEIRASLTLKEKELETEAFGMAL